MVNLWDFFKDILFTFTRSHFHPQLDTLVQEHIPDLYVHFQSQVSFSNKLFLFIQNLNVSLGNPHEPLRKQLVLDSLHHLPLSPNRLQVIVLLSTSSCQFYCCGHRHGHGHHGLHGHGLGLGQCY